MSDYTPELADVAREHDGSWTVQWYDNRWQGHESRRGLTHEEAVRMIEEHFAGSSDELDLEG